MNEYLNIQIKGIYLYYQQKLLQMENIKTYYSLIKSIFKDMKEKNLSSIQAIELYHPQRKRNHSINKKQKGV